MKPHRVECSETLGVYLGLNAVQKPAAKKGTRKLKLCPENHHGNQPLTPDRLNPKSKSEIDVCAKESNNGDKSLKIKCWRLFACLVKKKGTCNRKVEKKVALSTTSLRLIVNSPIRHLRIVVAVRSWCHHAAHTSHCVVGEARSFCRRRAWNLRSVVVEYHAVLLICHHSALSRR